MGPTAAWYFRNTPRPRFQSVVTNQDYNELKLKCLETIRTESMLAFESQND